MDGSENRPRGTHAAAKPPGSLMLSYGTQTPLVGHIVYGALVEGFVSLAS
jgi:hypothetical protein